MIQGWSGWGSHLRARHLFHLFYFDAFLVGNIEMPTDGITLASGRNASTGHKQNFCQFTRSSNFLSGNGVATIGAHMQRHVQNGKSQRNVGTTAPFHSSSPRYACIHSNHTRKLLDPILSMIKKWLHEIFPPGISIHIAKWEIKQCEV